MRLWPTVSCPLPTSYYRRESLIRFPAHWPPLGDNLPALGIGSKKQKGRHQKFAAALRLSCQTPPASVPAAQAALPSVFPNHMPLSHGIKAASQTYLGVHPMLKPVRRDDPKQLSLFLRARP
jgi:hypothetical protein